MGSKRKQVHEACYRLPESQPAEDHQMLFDIRNHSEWSKDYCLVSGLPGHDDTEKTKVRVCIKTLNELWEEYEEEIFKPLEEDIADLFLDFSYDLVQQDTPLGKESETNPAGEFADDIYRDYQWIMPDVKTSVKKKKGQRDKVPIDKFYFLLVQPVDKKDRIRVCGYVYSEEYWDNHYLKHVYCTLRGTNMGSALVHVAMRNARECHLKFTLLNFNPVKKHLIGVYERLGFRIPADAREKRLFTDDRMASLNDTVHSTRMLQNLTENQNDFVQVGLKCKTPENTRQSRKRNPQSLGPPVKLASLTKGLYCLAIGGDRSAAYFV
jgi:hypothetical protein